MVNEELKEIAESGGSPLNDGLGLKTGEDFIATVKGHKAKKNCQKCGLDLSTTGLVDIVYTFEVCDCEDEGYKHLVETLWHRRCFCVHN